MSSQQRAGNVVRAWSMSGFEGMKCGQVQCGTRGVETIVRLTGEYAAPNWRRFYQLADNVSRLDMQVTVDSHLKASTVVAKHYGQAARARRKNGRFPKVWECRDSDGPATLYFGKRVSELFARVYDKYSQAGEGWPRGAVRYELQCNGQQAMLNAKKVYGASSESLAINGRVHSYFATHGLRSLWTYEGVDNYSCPRRRSDLDQRLLWLSTAVAPSVRLLMDAGRAEEMLRALGLTRSRQGNVITLREVKAS